MPGYLQSHQISPTPSQYHCLPLFHVLPGEGGGGITSAARSQDIACGDWGCAANKQHIISGWAVVSWLGLGLGWCMADRALCERVRTGTLWNVTASPPPKITCGGPWPWVAFFCGPLRSGKWPGHQGARGCGEPQRQRGSPILYDPGEVDR